ncbi:hypothetical protein Lal_00020820, partial [Lupinus albus]
FLEGPSLSYHHLEDQLALLGKVLNIGDDAARLEELDEDTDEIALNSARCSQGSMSAMSGSKRMVYMECICDFYNYSSNMACLKCNIGRLEDQPTSEYEEHMWRRAT